MSSIDLLTGEAKTMGFPSWAFKVCQVVLGGGAGGQVGELELWLFLQICGAVSAPAISRASWPQLSGGKNTGGWTGHSWSLFLRLNLICILNDGWVLASH